MGQGVPGAEEVGEDVLLGYVDVGIGGSDDHVGGGCFDHNCEAIRRIVVRVR